MISSLWDNCQHMTSNHKLGSTFAAWALFVLTSGAVELTFTSPTATFVAPIEKSGQDVEFAFVNSSSETITITEIQTGCGCITPTLEKRKYTPGEKGKLEAHVDFQHRTGPIRKTIRVKVRGEANSTEQEQLLKIDGEALTPLKLSSLTVLWANGDEPTAKELLVTIKPGFEISHLVVEDASLSKNFSIQSQPLVAGGLSISIKPLTLENDKVVLVDNREMQQGYFLTYTYLPLGITKRERFYAIIHRK